MEKLYRLPSGEHLLLSRITGITVINPPLAGKSIVVVVLTDDRAYEERFDLAENAQGFADKLASYQIAEADRQKQETESNYNNKTITD